MKQTFWLPMPPTANTMFGLRGHRRFVSKGYAQWKDHAGAHLMMQKPVKHEGQVGFSMWLKHPRNIKWDLDNRIKPVLDLLVTHQIIEDDHSGIVRPIFVDVGSEPGAIITLEAA